MTERPEVKCPNCKSSKVIKLIGTLVPMGTRDGFGIKNAFVDDVSHKTIDNWKDWERAGYRDPVLVTHNNTVKEKIKEKIEIVKHKGA